MSMKGSRGDLGVMISDDVCKGYGTGTWGLFGGRAW